MEIKFFRTADKFLPQNEWRNFRRDEIRTIWGENNKIQIKLAITYKKNEQKNAKNVAELQTKRTKTT